jgi:hypothetical protein
MRYTPYQVPVTNDDTERYSGHDKVHRRQAAGVSGGTDNRECNAASFPRLTFIETARNVTKAQQTENDLARGHLSRVSS